MEKKNQPTIDTAMANLFTYIRKFLCAFQTKITIEILGNDKAIKTKKNAPLVIFSQSITRTEIC
ncbi:hypothetical protein HZS_3026 [Henneguya salminicola]|nr:hypothetical protein HZS_3026 [Henneguya salminicola]